MIRIITTALAAATVAIGLSACTPAQFEKAQSYHEKIAAACAKALS